MEKKYKLTDEYIVHHGVKLFRIEALKDFDCIEKGYKGGFVENELNLAHYGDCWIYDDAKVYGNSRVSGNRGHHTCAMCACKRQKRQIVPINAVFWRSEHVSYVLR